MYTWLKSKTDNVTEILADNKKLVSFTSLTPLPHYFEASPAFGKCYEIIDGCIFFLVSCGIVVFLLGG